MPGLSPPLADRMAAVASYLGLAPLQFLFYRGNREVYREHHLRLALALWFVLGVVSVIFATTILGLSYALVHARELYEGRHLEYYLLGTTRKLYICWLVCWVYATVLAVLGFRWHIPLISQLGRRSRLRHFTALAMSGFAILLLAVVPFAVHAYTIIRSDEAPARVCLLYEDVDTFPRWIFTFGFYPIALEANAQLGAGSVLALPLSRAAIDRSFSEAEFVYIGSHGTSRGLMLKEGWFKPEDIEESMVNENLRYVYIAGCDSGAQRDAWESALQPARVVTFDRLSAVIEHAWWLWIEGPDVVRDVFGDSARRLGHE